VTRVWDEEKVAYITYAPRPSPKITMSATLKSRNYCFTWNNPSLKPNELIAVLKPLAKYAVFQTERGTGRVEASGDLTPRGTEHYQGYVELTKPTRITALQKLVKMSYFERRGTREQARNYCMKDDTRVEGPWEIGTWTGKSQGRRMDLERLITMAKDPKVSDVDILDALPTEYMRFYKCVDRIRSLPALQKPKVRDDLEVAVFYGPPGTGKTHTAYEFDSDLYAIPVNDGKSMWFDGYRGERTLLIDDFKGNMKLTNLLRILDKYPIQVPVKGGFVYLQCVTILITSNYHPNDWYDWHSPVDRTPSRGALLRRINMIKKFESKDAPPVTEEWIL